MAKSNWLKLNRSILQSDVFGNPNLLKVWIWCLCKASHKEHKVTVGLQSVTLEQGQFIFGRKKASYELGIPGSSLNRYIKRLESLGNLSIKANNKFSVVTIANWRKYQLDDDESEQQNEQQMDNKWTTNGQQMDTNKNVKKGKNVKNDYYSLNLEDRLKMAGVIGKE